MIAKKSIKCQTPIKQPQTNTAEPCGKQTTYYTWCIVQYCGTVWNLKTSPQGQSSFVVSGPCPTRSGEKQWRARFHDASKLTKIDQHCLLSVTLLSPFGHPAITFHSLSSLPVFKIKNTSPVASLLSLFLDVHWSIAVPSPWCSCLKEPHWKSFFSRRWRHWHWHSFKSYRFGNQGCNRGLVDPLSSSLLTQKIPAYIQMDSERKSTCAMHSLIFRG